MPKLHNFYPKGLWMVTHFWSDMAVNTVPLNKVYLSYSKQIVRVCFLLFLQSTPQLKRKRFFRINFNSLAMPSLNEALCYHSHEHLDAIKDEFYTFNYFTLSSLHSIPASFNVLPETTDDNFTVH